MGLWFHPHPLHETAGCCPAGNIVWSIIHTTPHPHPAYCGTPEHQFSKWHLPITLLSWVSHHFDITLKKFPDSCRPSKARAEYNLSREFSCQLSVLPVITEPLLHNSKIPLPEFSWVKNLRCALSFIWFLFWVLLTKRQLFISGF